MKHILTMIVCVFGIAAPAFSSDDCVQTKYGLCFRIHARYAVYTGDGMEVLWPVGTHRLLWAAYGTVKLDMLLDNRMDDYFVFGDFVVCPLMKDVPGEMRHVCIQKMQNLRVVNRKQVGQ